MAVEKLLHAETESLGDLLKKDGIFRVPVFQRDYSWKPENWEELWNDIKQSKSTGNKHYMGSIVLINRDKKIYDVVDGQQRLTTLTLIILSVIDCLKKLVASNIDVDNNTKRIELLMENYIGKKSLSSLNFNTRLVLNEENDPFYSTYLVNFRDINNIKTASESNKQLYYCFRYFSKLIYDEVYAVGGVDELINFVEFILDNLLFIEISADSDLSAYMIFETLNDRGLELTVTDLLKNYLFSIVDPSDQIHVKNYWNNIMRSVPYVKFPKFLRHYWISKNKLIQEKELFKVIKNNINTPIKVFELLKELDSIAPIYCAFSNEQDAIWNDYQEAKKYIYELNLLNVTQCYPLMLCAYNNMDYAEWIKVFNICRIISFRSSIAGSNPNVFEEGYNKAVIGILKGEKTTARDVFADLKSLYIDDESFSIAFSNKIISSKTSKPLKLIRYILILIENHINSTTIDYKSDSISIEHILPENPSESWDEYFNKDIQPDYIYRIGNYSLLEPKLNRDIGNLTFEKKKERYPESAYKMARDLISLSDWNPEQLDARQKKIAKQATALWKLNY